MRKVGESVNVKKKKKRVQFDEYNFLLFEFLSKILHFLFFKTKRERERERERENINNLVIRRMWLNFNIE